MATVVPAPAPSYIAEAFNTSFQAAQNRQVEQRRLDITESYNKALEKQVDFHTNDLARQIQVDKARGFKAEADTKQAELNAFNLLTPDEQKNRLLAQSRAVKNRSENDALRAQINSSNQANNLLKQQMQANKFVYDQSLTAGNAVRDVVPSAEGNIIANQISKYTQMKLTGSPEQQAAATVRLTELETQSVDAARTYEQQQLGEKKELKQTGASYGFGKEEFANLPKGMRARVINAELGLTPKVEIRAIEKGRFPGGRPGFLPFGDRYELLDYTEAKNKGYTDEDWNAAGPLEAPTVKEGVSKQVKGKNTKEPTTIRVRKLDTEEVGPISIEEYRERANEFEAI